MKRLFIIASIVFVALTSTFAQEQTPPKPLFEFYGFVRLDAFVDTYKGLNAANEQFHIVPLYTGEDANGKDLNQVTSYNFSSMASRFGVRVNGPEIFKAKTIANIEADFAGDLANNPAMLRVRQANVSFIWKKSTLLVGQTWHPFWSGKVFPTVGALTTGCPFQPFNRSPQIRYDYRTGLMTFSGALVSEFQYKSFGFSKVDSMNVKGLVLTDNKSEQYNRNAALPELCANIELNKGGFTAGAGASLKYIKPTTYTIGADKKKYMSDDLLQSLSFVGYAQYTKGMLTLRAKSVLGQNMSHLTMPGGYGVSAIDATTGSMEYTPYNSSYSYLNAVYGKKYQVGIFAGYMKNLGTKDALLNFGTTDKPAAVTPGMLPQIASIYRVAPHFSVNVSKVRLVFEYELTSAKYGVGAINVADGLYSDHKDAVNNRGLIMLMYMF